VTEQVTVITAALPTRQPMLQEACASVAAQTVPPAAHLVGVDHRRDGSAVMRNRLAFAADTPWLAFLDDDDLLLPHHLEALLGTVDGADVAYSYCHVQGREWTPNRPFDPDALRASNYIPATVLIRSDAFRRAGGFRPSGQVQHGWEDWDLWLRLLDAGCRFAWTDTVTWLYRFHEGNKTMLGEREAR
jgi:hypothetical protein